MVPRVINCYRVHKGKSVSFHAGEMDTDTAIFDTTSEQEPVTPPVALPFALIFSFGIIGALFLLVLLLIGVTIACCVVKRKRANRQFYNARESERRTSQVLIGSTATPVHTTPHYSQVIKKPTVKREESRKEGSSSPPPPLPPPPLLITPSPQPLQPSPILQIRPATPTKPQELVSYNTDIPKTLIPYAPPPPVSGLASSENLHRIDNSHNVYDIPMDSLADYDEVDSFEGSTSGSPTRHLRKPTRSMSLQTYPHRHRHQNHRDDSHYNEVESGSMTSSLQLANHHIKEGHYQSPKRRAGRQPSNSSHNEPTFLEPLEPSMLHSSLSSIGSDALLPYGPIYASPRSLRSTEQPLEISRSNILEIRDLGKGRFGPIVLAATVNLTLKDLLLGESNHQSRSFLVAMKKLRNDADQTTKTAFHEEIRFLSKLKHANVVRLLGVCSTPSAPFIIMEYMENGDLNSFLQRLTLVADDTRCLGEGEATPLILLYMAVQISSGMRYLASRKFVHRDLATRNCLVGKEFVVKISDFGMSEVLYDSYYYRVRGQLILPIRWMPYESFYGKFSIKSDVWSFGVTLWEIYCMAEREPYAEMSDAELINDATKGQRRVLLKKPEICPQDVYDIMLRCWVHEPNMRADFEEIYSRLFLAYMIRSQQASS